MLRKRAWRVEPAQVEMLRTSAQKYIATHNFHNFTVNGVFSDRSNQRIMKNIVVSALCPFLVALFRLIPFLRLLTR